MRTVALLISQKDVTILAVSDFDLHDSFEPSSDFEIQKKGKQLVGFHCLSLFQNIMHKCQTSTVFRCENGKKIPTGWKVLGAPILCRARVSSTTSKLPS